MEGAVSAPQAGELAATAQVQVANGDPNVEHSGPSSSGKIAWPEEQVGTEDTSYAQTVQEQMRVVSAERAQRKAAQAKEEQLRINEMIAAKQAAKKLQQKQKEEEERRKREEEVQKINAKIQAKKKSAPKPEAE